MRKIFFTVAVIALTLCGCEDGRDIEERSYVLTASVDKFSSETEIMSEGENKFTIGLFSANLSEDGLQADGEPKRTSGESVEEALKSAEPYYKKPPYLGQLKTLIISEDILNDGELLEQTLKWVESENDVSMKTLMVCAEGKAFDIAKALADDENQGTLYVWDYYRNGKRDVDIPDAESALSQYAAEGAIKLPLIKEKDGGAIIE